MSTFASLISDLAESLLPTVAFAEEEEEVSFYEFLKSIICKII